MARLAGVDRLRNVAELGAGTGPITRAILDEMPSTGRLWSFEIDADLAAGLRDRFRDSRLTVVQDSAVEAPRIAREAGIERFDAIVSAIPYSLLPHALALDLLTAARDSLMPGAPMVLIQYRPNYLTPLLQRVFGTYERHFHLWNLPPAYFFRMHARR
jgi:phospholipid N-methyltransferase